MANVGEQISRVVDKELEDVEKACIRPLQVHVHVFITTYVGA